MMKIDSIQARSITDSRGKPTVEVTITSGEHSTTASAPSGKSTGSREALELRDSDGAGVTHALKNIDEIITSALIGPDWGDIHAVDEALIALDGTPNKAHLGSNATLPVSLAAAKLFAKAQGVPLWKYISNIAGTMPHAPGLYMNVLNGGEHAAFRLPFQEYIIVCKKETAVASYEAAQTLFKKLGEYFKESGKEVPLGDEGGYSPDYFTTISEPFAVLTDLIGDDSDLFLAIDAAASAFYKDGVYTLLNTSYNKETLLDVYEKVVREYPLRSIEDPFDESDTEGFQMITKKLGDTVRIVGDDLTVTNKETIVEISEKHAANAVIIKPNQIGTLSETLDAALAARGAGWDIIVSHRSGETIETAIADIAFGLGAFGMKAGAPSQPERRVKYERLLEIETEFGNNENI